MSRGDNVTSLTACLAIARVVDYDAIRVKEHEALRRPSWLEHENAVTSVSHVMQKPVGGLHRDAQMFLHVGNGQRAMLLQQVDYCSCAQLSPR